MNPGRFSMPGMAMGFNPMMRAGYMAPRSFGLFGRIGSSLRNFNWRGFLSGANKTLDVFNQTIPLIRQAKPMFNNMKSMIQLAKAFGNETTSTRGRNRNNQRMNNYNDNSTNFQNRNTINTDNNLSNSEVRQKKEARNSNYPNFFI